MLFDKAGAREELLPLDVRRAAEVEEEERTRMVALRSRSAVPTADKAL